MSTPLPLWNFDFYKVKLTFDNNETYEVYTYGEQSPTLLGVKVTESDSLTISNPVGVMSPSQLNIDIYDDSLILVPTNTESPYYGYMRNGVKVELFHAENIFDEEEREEITQEEYNSLSWQPYGIYYVDAWDNIKEAGGYGLVSLSCSDNLNYIGNMEIPSLSAYVSTDARVLLQDIFTKIGLSSSDVVIDSSLSLNMLFSIAKGDLVRDVLNTIAQAMLARIFCNRRGVIEIRPAFPSVSTPNYLIDLDEFEDIESFGVTLNDDTSYNKVKLVYSKTDNKPSSVLLTLNNVTLHPGLNEFKNINLNTNVLSIDGVRLAFNVDNTYTSGIAYIKYTASQSGLDIFIYSTLAQSKVVILEVTGKPFGETEAFIESTLALRDIKVGKTLVLESYIIQDDQTAQSYIARVTDYLYRLEQRFTMRGVLTPKIKIGDYLQVTSLEDITLNGLYQVVSLDISHDQSSYSTSINLVKVRS